jgi:dTDP-4-amino-4,6-dideoxygalactose transaminase
VLALRVAVGEGGIVALPAYGCVDFASAVQFAGVRVRLYDIDPVTMSPDLDAVRRTLRRGVAAIVVAHYYGYPADIDGVKQLAAKFAVPVIEDAAQAAGGTLNGRRLGTIGELTVLSFGRGKGIFGGGGGALLARTADWGAHLSALRPFRPRAGGAELGGVVAQWALGRPSVYAIPAALPALKLGAMVYHPAHEPRALSGIAAKLVRASLAGEAPARAKRRLTVAVLRTMLERLAGGLLAVPPLADAEPGYLRFGVLDLAGRRRAAPRLGVMSGYPRTLNEQPELGAHLVAGEPPTPGAAALRDTLFTLPTHDLLDERDLLALQRWMMSAGVLRPQVGVAAVQRRHAGDGAVR